MVTVIQKTYLIRNNIGKTEYTIIIFEFVKKLTKLAHVDEKHKFLEIYISQIALKLKIKLNHFHKVRINFSSFNIL